MITMRLMDAPPRAKKHDNDNDPQSNKHTVMVARNGGCSTTSGLVPVSVANTATDKRVAA